MYTVVRSAIVGKTTTPSAVAVAPVVTSPDAYDSVRPIVAASSSQIYSIRRCLHAIRFTDARPNRIHWCEISDWQEDGLSPSRDGHNISPPFSGVGLVSFVGGVNRPARYGQIKERGDFRPLFLRMVLEMERNVKLLGFGWYFNANASYVAYCFFEC
uniref:Uncharacterized protein n=1 Tax=Kalanchoe fedtschenkoi TaxID=63787 RepID=A0A7N0TSE8_KALFE